MRRRIVSFADFTAKLAGLTASVSFIDWNSEFFADSNLESTVLTGRNASFLLVSLRH